MVLGKFPPGKLPPIKLPPGEFFPGKSPPRKLPPGIFPPISLIRRYYKRLCSSTLSFVLKCGEWVGVYTLPISWTKIFNISKTPGNFSCETLVLLRKYYWKHFVTNKSKILSICACTYCNFSVPFIIYLPSFTRKNSFSSSLSTS